MSRVAMKQDADQNQKVAGESFACEEFRSSLKKKYQNSLDCKTLIDKKTLLKAIYSYRDTILSGVA